MELIAAVSAFITAATNPRDYRDRRFHEFSALSTSSGGPKNDLWVQEVIGHDLHPHAIDKVFAVRKLREVRAIIGFQRGNVPIDPAFDGGEQKQNTCLLGKTSSYPAYENLGEGIFFRLSSEKLIQWLARSAVKRRALAFRAAEHSWRDSTSRGGESIQRALYVATHSLAHLVIRQLSLVSGYSQSSLRERIFVSPDSSESPWAGFLIYTASSDADGSLGGLVAQAVDLNLKSIMAEGMRALAICSSDPICALQTPEGFRKLNGAACHKLLGTARDVL